MTIKKQEGYYVVILEDNNLVLFRSLTRRFCVEWMNVWNGQGEEY